MSERAPDELLKGEQFKGSVLYFISVVCLAISDLSGKWLVVSYPVGQIVFVRSLVATVVNLVVAFVVTGDRIDLLPRHIWLHILRGVLIFSVNALFFLGAARAPLADATAIFLTGSLLASIGSVWLFRDRASSRLYLANILGLIGAVAIIDPVWQSSMEGGLFALAAAVLYAAGTLLARYATSIDSESNVGVWGNAMAAMTGALTIPFFSYVAPGLGDQIAFVAVGAFAGLATFSAVFAYARSPLTILMVLDYWIVVWSGVGDYVIWSTIPDLQSLLGGAMIFIATLIAAFGTSSPAP